jgi:Transglutaminase-like superfamily
MYGATHRFIALADSDGWVVFLDIKKGQWYVGNPSFWAVWEHLEMGLDLENAVKLAAGTRIPLETLQGDIERQTPRLEQLGILATRWKPPGKAARRVLADGPPASARVSVKQAEADSPSGYVTAAIVGFSIAIMLQRVPFWLKLRIIRASRRLRPQRPTLESTTQLVRAVSHIARRHKGMAECLEISLGAFLAGTMLGKAPTWCIGAHTNPLRCHAWLEVDGTAVDSAHGASDRRYRAMIRV